MEQPEKHISLGHVRIGELEKLFVNEVLESNRLSPGKFIHGFEAEFAALHGCPHAIMCNSGASALHIALAALKERYGWNAGDEVIVPSVTLIAAPNAILHNDLRPVFVEIDPSLYIIDPSRIRAKITRRTRAILPAHLFGLPCDMDAMRGIAEEHGLQIIEDATQAVFAEYKGRPVGSMGNIACFSTDAGQIIGTGVGGVITTKDPEVALICRSLLSQGRDTMYLTIDDDDDLQEEAHRRQVIERRFSFIRLGYSARVTEVEGALGLAQLAARDRILAQRRENAQWLTERMARFSEFLQLPALPSDRTHSFSAYPMVVKGGVGREPLVDYLEAHGIETRYMLPLLNQPIYKKLFGSLESRYPVARWINRNGFYIGCHHGLTGEDLSYVVRHFETFFKEYEVQPDDAA